LISAWEGVAGKGRVLLIPSSGIPRTLKLKRAVQTFHELQVRDETRVLRNLRTSR